MKRIIVYASLFAVALTVVSCKPKAEADAAAGTNVVEERIQPVKVNQLAYVSTAIDEEVTATLNAIDETYMAPALSGRIRSIKVDVNDKVNKGDLLVEMDPTQYDQTRLQLATLKKDLSRLDTLLRYGSTTQQSYDQVKTQVEVTEVVLANLKENTNLKAPFNGIITGKYYNDGELFAPTPNTPAGKAAIISIVNMDELKVFANLSEKYLPLVKTGMSTEISTDVYPDQVFTGKVVNIYPTINPATRTFQVEVRLKNSDGKLRPGMFARVRMTLGKRDAIVAPAVAVLNAPGTNDKYVYIEKDGKAHQVFVTVLKRYDDRFEITSPELKGGENLIVTGNRNLTEQMPVKIVND
ncbi:MAG: efflux RND transporter periplasmic adaptor subunit [Bacteroidota bacterium]